jgi:hypothetical protein
VGAGQLWEGVCHIQRTRLRNRLSDSNRSRRGARGSRGGDVPSESEVSRLRSIHGTKADLGPGSGRDWLARRLLFYYIDSFCPAAALRSPSMLM